MKPTVLILKLSNGLDIVRLIKKSWALLDTIVKLIYYIYYENQAEISCEGEIEVSSEPQESSALGSN